MSKMEQNVFYQLRDTIVALKEFLDGNVLPVKAGIDAMRSIMPQTAHLIDNLIYLLENLRNTLATMDTGSIPNLRELSAFGTKINVVLHAVMQLLPNEPYMIDDVERSARVIGDLPSLSEVKGEILGPLDGVIGHLYELKA